MIKLLLILLPFTASGQQGQPRHRAPYNATVNDYAQPIDSFPCAAYTKLDTVPHDLITGARKYNYYNKNGSLAWGGVAEYSEALIPIGGRYTIEVSNVKIIKGFRVWSTQPDCKMKVVGYLDAKKKPYIIPKPWYEVTSLL